MATPLAAPFSFGELPILKLNNEDKAGSWKAWYRSFKLSIEMISLSLGTEKVNGEDVRVFRGRRKTLALLHAVGEAGQEALGSVGFDISDPAATYEEALAHLKEIYVTDESVYVRTNRLVTVSQAEGESETDYLLRVEKLSRDLDMNPDHDECRLQFTISIAVNGLRDSSLRTCLMMEGKMKWDALAAKLRARRSAKESEAIIVRSRNHTSVKQEPTTPADVYRVERNDGSKDKRRYRGSHRSRRRSWSPEDESKVDDWRRRSSRRKKSRSPPPRREGCYQCGSANHFIRKCPRVKCYTCKGKGHTSVDCSFNNSMRRRDNRDSSRSSMSSRSSSNSSRGSASSYNSHKSYGSPTRNVSFAGASKHRSSKSKSS